MGRIIRFSDYCQKAITKGDKMYKILLNDIRRKPKGVNDMPARADEVLEYFAITDFSEGVPIIQILMKLGFKIYQSDLEPDELSAYIAINPKYEDFFQSNKLICVNVRDSIGHKRFALAHELAHYLFDFDESKDLYYYNTYFARKEEYEEEEERANKFATNLLMPERVFRKKYEEYQGFQSKLDIVSNLSRYFLVSSTAVLRRFRELAIEGFEYE